MFSTLMVYYICQIKQDENIDFLLVSKSLFTPKIPLNYIYIKNISQQSELIGLNHSLISS